MFSIKQAAAKAGISEGLLLLWVSTGKFTPSIGSSLKSTDFTGSHVAHWNLTQGQVKRLLAGIVLCLTDADLERLRAMVEETAQRKVRAESAHKPGTHYSVQELAAVWGLGVDKIRELFENEPDVIKLQSPPKKGKRAYVTLRIPEKVADRVQRRNS